MGLAAAVSTAISMKRIADALQYICDYAQGPKEPCK